MIKTIIFDLGKVIVPFDFQRAYQTFEMQSGIPAVDIRQKLAGTDLYRRFESGLIQPRDFADEVSRHLNMQIPYDEFCAVWTSIFPPETLLSEEFFASLASRYRLVLLSNTNVIHFEMVRATYPLLRHFHAFVLSYEAGEMKPAAGIYRKAVEAAGCQAGECLFIDDMQENVEGARKEGIDAVLFLSAEQLKADLRQRGLLPHSV